MSGAGTCQARESPDRAGKVGGTTPATAGFWGGERRGRPLNSALTARRHEEHVHTAMKLLIILAVFMVAASAATNAPSMFEPALLKGRQGDIIVIHPVIRVVNGTNYNIAMRESWEAGRLPLRTPKPLPSFHHMSGSSTKTTTPHGELLQGREVFHNPDSPHGRIGAGLITTRGQPNSPNPTQVLYFGKNWKPGDRFGMLVYIVEYQGQKIPVYDFGTPVRVTVKKPTPGSVKPKANR